MAGSARPERIGPWQIRALDTGFFRLDGGAMFGAIPQALWSKTNPPDEKNRIRMAMRCLLLEGEGRKILVDVGIGDKLPDKLVGIYGVDPAPTLASALADAGLAPAAITDVVLTHLHFDHAGGATRRHGTRLTPTFPRARYYLQRRNLENARHPNPRERASYMAENFEPLVEAGMLETWEGPQAPWPGIEVWTAEGHTRGQQLVRVSGAEGVLYFVADLIPTAAHVRIPYCMGYDVAAIETMEEKRAFLARATQENAWVLLEHDAQIAWARPQAVENDFAWADTISADGAGTAARAERRS